MSAELIGVLPELIVAAGGLILLLLPIRSSRLLGLITLAFLFAAFDRKVFTYRTGTPFGFFFFGTFLHDPLANFFQWAIFLSVGLVVLAIVGYAKEELRCRRELYALLLMITTGLLFLVGAQHLALVYVGLELVSLLSYLLTGFLKKESLSAEGALKYFLFGSLASGAFLYGVSLIYGLTGTMDIPYLSSLSVTWNKAPVLGTIAILLLMVGLGFKVALVPFHMWAPDAYEGAPTPVAAFLSVGPKLAGFALIARIFLEGFSPSLTLWPYALAFLSFLTMTFGNLVALAQTNVKRLLAYSSIAHAGTMLIGLAVASPLGLTATLYYLVAYLLMNMGAFLGVIVVGHASGREDLGAFAGLSRREPALAAMITLSLLSLAGIPPMAGFFAKMWIFGAALKAGSIWLAIAAAVNSVISLFYYAKIIKAMYLDPVPASLPSVPAARSLRLALTLCTVGLVLFGLFPGNLFTFAANAVPPPLHSKLLPWL